MSLTEDVTKLKRQVRWIAGAGIGFLVVGGLVALLVAIHLIHDYHAFEAIERQLKEMKK